MTRNTYGKTGRIAKPTVFPIRAYRGTEKLPDSGAVIASYERMEDAREEFLAMVEAIGEGMKVFSFYPIQPVILRIMNTTTRNNQYSTGERKGKCRNSEIITRNWML